jgi:hypothetical protein
MNHDLNFAIFSFHFSPIVLSVARLNIAFKMVQTSRNPPFRAEHLGSLLRPKDFLAQRSAFEKKELSQADLTAAEDKSITEVVKIQTEIGLRGVTDGEYRYETLSRANASKQAFLTIVTDVLYFGVPSSRSWRA